MTAPHPSAVDKRRTARWRAAAGRCALAAWMLSSLAALGLMYYSLWWGRDGRLYGGKAREQQLRTVFQRAGLNPRIVPDLMQLDRAWPANVHYRLEGGEHNQSYVKYVLAPRIPSGKGFFRAQIGERGIEASPPPGVVVKAAGEGKAGPWGWILSIGLAAGIGFLASRGMSSWSLSVPEMLGAGALAVACLVTGSKALSGDASHGMMALALAGSFGLGGIGVAGVHSLVAASRRRAGKSEGSLGLRIPARLMGRILLAGCALVLLLGVGLSLLLSVIVVPDDWDAWAIWGAKAKVLAAGSGPLEDVTFFGHRDYPLLWPSVWAFSAWLSGGWEECWCRGWGAVFLALAAWQIATVVKRLGSGATAGWLGAAVFVSIPKVVVVSSWSYAEGALWLLSICFWGRLLQGVRTGGRRSFLLAGVFAGASALTKNEGALLAALGGGFVLAVAPPGRRWATLAAYAAPVAILYGPWVWWVRFEERIPSQFVSVWTFSARELCHAVQRWPKALSMIGGVWADWRQWGIVLPLLGVGAVWLLVHRSRLARRMVWFPLLMLAAYLGIVLCVKDDVSWQVQTAWDRLTVQAVVLLIPVVVASLSRVPRGCEKIADGGAAGPPGFEKAPVCEDPGGSAATRTVFFRSIC